MIVKKIWISVTSEISFYFVEQILLIETVMYIFVLEFNIYTSKRRRDDVYNLLSLFFSSTFY